MPCCTALSRAAAVTGPAARSSVQPSRSKSQFPQHRGSICRAAKQEQDDTPWCGDNTVEDLGPKPYTLPTSEELRQKAKDFQYDGNLALPMLGIAAVLCLLASVFPGHA